jgi:hypothetical protein
MSEWLEKLKIGDPVIVVSDRGKRFRCDSVTHATNTSIFCGLSRFMRKTGDIPVAQQSFGMRDSIREPTPELMAQAEEQALRLKLERRLQVLLNHRKMPLEQVKALLAYTEDLK